MAGLDDDIKTVVVFREIRRKSGGTCSYYVDGRRLLSSGPLLVRCANAIAVLATMLGATHVGGEVASALPLAGAVSFASGGVLDTFFIRESVKPNGISNLIEGRFDAGARALVVDDVIGVGSVAQRCVSLLRAQNVRVVGFCAVIDRGELPAEFSSRLDTDVWRLYDLRRLRPWIASRQPHAEEAVRP